jgi:hypothetical protein
MISFSRGDVVIVDLGIVSKVPPCVVVSAAKPDSQRNMSVVVHPITRAISLSFVIPEASSSAAAS